MGSPAAVHAARVHGLAVRPLPDGRQVLNVLYFTSPHCRPCRSFGPLLKGELDELGFEAETVNIATYAGLAKADSYDVSSTPTVVIERDGEEISRFTGALLGDSLKDALSVLR
ncbi:thioredoxin family protein [Streptomyces sp. NPDC014802]|uniref:thioredoxin family protein n=1 Tax=Streptomyces sp. NPDC014802 TaxID=3364917 RepID=UPI003702568A